MNFYELTEHIQMQEWWWDKKKETQPPANNLQHPSLQSRMMYRTVQDFGNDWESFQSRMLHLYKMLHELNTQASVNREYMAPIKNLLQASQGFRGYYASMVKLTNKILPLLRNYLWNDIEKHQRYTPPPKSVPNSPQNGFPDVHDITGFVSSIAKEVENIDDFCDNHIMFFFEDLIWFMQQNKFYKQMATDLFKVAEGFAKEFANFAETTRESAYSIHTQFDRARDDATRAGDVDASEQPTLLRRPA